MQLAELVAEKKEEYDAKVALNEGKTRYDNKRKKYVSIKPTGRYFAKAVREFYPDLAKVKNDDPNFCKAVKLATRCYNEIEQLRDPSTCAPAKKRAIGGGRKSKAPEVREALFSWFVDVRESLKGRSPRRLFKLKANALYEEWLRDNPTPESEKLKFRNQWIEMWQKEYGVSLRKPNKRYSIKKEDLVERLQDYLKNVWSIRRYFIEKYGIDPPIINGDQMSLHRNESSSQKTLNFKGEETFVKENHMLSRERVTVFTQVSSDSKFYTPEFVFKGKGTRTKINVEEDIKFQWSPSGSYRLDQLLKTISNLPNRYHLFTQKDYAIYLLDDYAVHRMPEVTKALFQCGYILVIMGGGITGFIQSNDTHLHRKLKANYRDLEMELMMEKLQANKKKAPSPTREEMINMAVKASRKVDVSFTEVFKELFVTNKLHGCEEYLVSDKLFALIGNEMKEIRKKLIESPPPAKIQKVIKSIIPPKGTRRKNVEGTELLDISIEDVTTSTEQDEPEVSEAEEESDVDDDQPEETSTQEEKAAPEVQAAETSVAVNRSQITSLVDIRNDDNINKDARFLDAVKKAFDEYETSTVFKTHTTKMKLAFVDARRSLKRIIKKTESDVVEESKRGEADSQESDEEKNLFDTLFN